MTGRRRQRGSDAIGSYGLVILLALLVAGFSIARPASFPHMLTFNSILSGQSVVFLLVIGELLAIIANQFDLSVGYLAGTTHVLVIGLQTRSALPWGAAVGCVLAIGLLFGAANAIIVTKFRVGSFIATLGSGTVLYGVTQWYTHGTQVTGVLPRAFSALGRPSPFDGLPWSFLFVLVVSVVVWIVLDYLPIGRKLYVVGANPRAAELCGIRSTRYIVFAFCGSGLFGAVGGVILGAQLGVGEPSLGPDYLLPVFAAIFLGATSIRPGRANVWGSVIAVLVIAVAVTGLQQLGADYYVEYLFNGGIVIVAVAVSGYGSRRRIERSADTTIRGPDSDRNLDGEISSDQVSAPA